MAQVNPVVIPVMIDPAPSLERMHQMMAVFYDSVAASATAEAEKHREAALRFSRHIANQPELPDMPETQVLKPQPFVAQRPSGPVEFDEFPVLPDLADGTNGTTEGHADDKPKPTPPARTGQKGSRQ